MNIEKLTYNQIIAELLKIPTIAETFTKKELKQLPHKSLSQLVLYAIAYQKKEALQ